MKRKTTTGIMLALLIFASIISIPSVNAQSTGGEEGEDNAIEILILESPDTFANDTEYDVNQIDDDLVIITINCPGIFGFC